MNSLRATWLTALALALIAGPVAAAPPSSAPHQRADNGYCQLGGMTTFVWQGAYSTAWENGLNWSGGAAPGESGKATSYVCIPAGKTVIADANVTSYIQAIDVASTATLTLERGSKLHVYGDKSTRPSYFRQGSTIRMSGTLGGTGTYNLAGQMTWLSEAAGASAIRTRSCQAGGDDCSGPVPPGDEGLITVTDTGVLNVGAEALSLGVNFGDQYRLVVRGQLNVQGVGFVAADDGTSLELRPRLAGHGVGRLSLNGDGGWYEGFLDATLGLTRVVNEGLIVKAAGTGTSVISAQYQRVGVGAVQVNTGTLMLPDTAATAAKVAKNASIGTGRCNAYNCQPAPTSADKQVVSVKVPVTDTDGATMTVTETTETARPSGSFTPPVRVQAAGLLASASSAAVLTLRYDSSTLGGIASVAGIAVWRKPEGSSTYAKVPTCVSGNIPAGQVACVDRRAAWSKMLNGDAVMTVRTKGFSRWVARSNKLS